jgi:hypothetical protein
VVVDSDTVPDVVVTSTPVVSVPSSNPHCQSLAMRGYGVRSMVNKPPAAQVMVNKPATVL